MPTKKNQPQYAVISQTLINDIVKGKYPVGSMLPPELDMAEQFKVSRNTMRSALRTLVDMGLVSRRAGRGTQVQTRDINPNYVQAIESIASLFPDTVDLQFEVGSAKNISTDAEQSILLACPVGSRWSRLAVTSLKKEKKLSYGYVYLAPQFKNPKAKLGRLENGFQQVFESITGDRAFQVVQQCDVAMANAEVAKALSIEEGSALLRKATRFADEAGRVLMAVDFYCLPGQQHHTAHFRLNWAVSAQE